jgi:hypothetical protein
VNDELRRANDRHRHWVPLLVLGFLLLVAYLWTDWMALYPPPGIEAMEMHPVAGKALDDGDHLERSVWMFRQSKVSTQEQIHTLLLITGLGFLFAYYLPLRFKKQPLVLLSLLGGAWVLGPFAMVVFLAWHLLAYINFHAPTPARTETRICLAVFTFCAWLPLSQGPIDFLLVGALAYPLVYFTYARLYHPLLTGRARHWIGLSTAHSCLLFIAVSILWNWFSPDGRGALRPLGWLLFFWQWERVVMYHCDIRDGRVPMDLKVSEYLATFFSPAAFCNFHWLSRIPLGYAYLNRSFLARDKNRIVLSGLWLFTLSVAFFAFRPVFLDLLKDGVALLGGEPRTSYGSLIKVMRRGVVPDVATVWGVLLYQFFNFYLLWTAVAHLKVGLWRLFGYDIEPYFQKPFMSTNLVEMWKRYSYYYKEFLLRAFYYPVFLRFFKKQRKLRVFVATMAAAGFGNLIYHLVYPALAYGATAEIVGARLMSIPYYIMLGVAIALTQVYLLARGSHRRRPWQWGPKIGLDVLAVIGTVGFIILLRPFHHVPREYSNLDCVQMVLAAFGLLG